MSVGREIVSFFNKCLLEERMSKYSTIKIQTMLAAESPFWEKMARLLLVDLREMFFIFMVGGRKKKKKSSENDHFFNISRKNSKTSKVNQ